MTRSAVRAWPILLTAFLAGVERTPLLGADAAPAPPCSPAPAGDPPPSATPAAGPTAADPSPVPCGDQAPAPVAPDAASERPTGINGFFGRTTLNGFVDIYYSWSGNGRDPAEYRNFDVVQGRVQFSMAKIAVEKKAVDDSRLGFRVDLHGGPAADLVNASEPGGENHWKAMEQAYVSVLAPVLSGVTIDLGKFVTPVGAEVIESRENWNYSRSLLFAMAIPYYHFGARITWPIVPGLSVTGLFVKGWNAVHDNNDSQTVGLSANFSPSSRLSIVQNVMVGPEQAADNMDVRHLFNTVTTCTVHPRLKLMGDVVVGRDSTAGVPKRWQGAALYLRYQLSDRVAFSPRYEWYADPDGFTTGTAQNLRQMTVTSELRVSDLLARFEVRTDRSDQPSFASDGGASRSRTTLAVGLVYSFARGSRN